MSEKLTKETVNDTVLEILNPEKAKARENGISQTGALQSIIARAKAVNTQNLSKQVQRSR